MEAQRGDRLCCECLMLSWAVYVGGHRNPGDQAIAGGRAAPPAALHFLSKGGEEFPKLHVPPATVSFPRVWRQVNMDLKQGGKTGKPRDSWRKKCFSFPGGLVCISCWLRHKNFSITSKTAVRVPYIEATFSFLRQISDKAS